MTKIFVRSLLADLTIGEQRKQAVDRIKELLIAAPPYTSIEMTAEEYSVLCEELYVHGIRFDAWCVRCGREATFALGPFLDAKTIADLKHQANQIETLGSVGKVEAVIGRNPDDTVSRLVCTCARETHPLHFAIDVSYVWDAKTNKASTILTKFGQLPAMADMAQGEIEKYRHVLSEQDFREFNRAIGLASHSVGIGSFVYLRRIFERVIRETTDEAVADKERIKAIRSLRMDEIIAELRAHLPPFLVENASLYKILSKGIHELDEKTCLAAFETVKTGIELILDQRIAKKDAERKAEAAAKSIGKLHSALANSKRQP